MRRIGLIGLVVVLAAGCASFNSTTFRLEKAAADAGTGAVHAWNAYYPAATNGASQAECVKLTAEQTQVYEASRKLGATLQVIEGLRLQYVANSANTNLTALQAAVEAAGSQSGAIVLLVKTFMSRSPTP